MIITIARESGSGGYTVGKLLSNYYHIPVHDQDSLARLAKEKGMYDEMPDFFHESPVNSIVYALSMDFRNKKIHRTGARSLGAPAAGKGLHPRRPLRKLHFQKSCGLRLRFHSR